MGITGYETAEQLEADTALLDRLETFRLQAGKLMGLGDVSSTSVPKMTLVARAPGRRPVNTRTFIPVQPHTSIGVLGAVSVVTAHAAARRGRRTI